VPHLISSLASCRCTSVSCRLLTSGMTSRLPSSSRLSAQFGSMMHRASSARWAGDGGSLLNLSNLDGGTASSPCKHTGEHDVRNWHCKQALSYVV